MKDSWRDTFLLFSETEEHQARMAEAREAMHDMVVSYRKPYVAFSGGKDSTVLLWMAMQETSPMMVLHIDFGRWLMPRAIFREILRNAHAQGATLRIETSAQWERAGRNLPKRGIFGPVLFGRIEPQLVEEGYDLCLLGLRAEESLKRRRRTGECWSDRPAQIETAYPMRDLTWMDVWACIVSKGLPYLRYYDQQEHIGIGYDVSRISSFYVAGRGMASVDKVLQPRDLHQYV
jgi:sulfate adenylyltransferase subunit 2